MPPTPETALPDPTVAIAQTLPERLSSLDWPRILAQIDHSGFGVIQSLFSPEDCAQVTALYPETDRFRRQIVMERHQYGQGEYQYFAYPLPAIAQTLRESLYPQLVPLANRWQQAMDQSAVFPEQLSDFLAVCHQAGQTRPTPLLLKYAAGDYNCLHQDLYGDHLFPLQAAILLSEPGRDFTGGEFVLTEQKPRTQARVQVLNLYQGDAVIFAVNQRPVPGARGCYRVDMKHGVSPLHAGHRHCLGIIFHDAA